MLHPNIISADHIPLLARIEDAVRLEAKRATHDGYIWPRERRLMAVAACIRERMAEDLSHLIREAGAFETVCDDALIALGWTPEQVRRYGEQAVWQTRGENACGTPQADEHRPERAANLNNHARDLTHEVA